MKSKTKIFKVPFPNHSPAAIYRLEEKNGFDAYQAGWKAACRAFRRAIKKQVADERNGR
jgi:hypothetical protein